MAPQETKLQQEHKQELGVPSQLCAILCKKKIPNKPRGSREITW
jgi:hypothetical protein